MSVSISAVMATQANAVLLMVHHHYLLAINERPQIFLVVVVVVVDGGVWRGSPLAGTVQNGITITGHAANAGPGYYPPISDRQFVWLSNHQRRTGF